MGTWAASNGLSLLPEPITEGDLRGLAHIFKLQSQNASAPEFNPRILVQRFCGARARGDSVVSTLEVNLNQSNVTDDQQ